MARSLVVVPSPPTVVTVSALTDDLLIDAATGELLGASESCLGQRTAAHQQAAIGTCVGDAITILVCEAGEGDGTLFAHDRLDPTLGDGSVDLLHHLADLIGPLLDGLPSFQLAITRHRCSPPVRGRLPAPALEAWRPRPAR